MTYTVIFHGKQVEILQLVKEVGEQPIKPDIFI